MGHEAAKKKEISFSENAGDVTVKVEGTRVEFHTNGSILVYTNNAVKVSPIAIDDDSKPAAPAAPKIGDAMPDGTICAGILPDTGKAMYTTPTDASLTMTFNETKEYASKLDAHGHNDWRLPTKAEPKVLFNNRAAIGGFDVSGSDPAGWYWSGTQYDTWIAWDQRFSDGYQSYNNKGYRSSVRCVR
jgi:hypothetical protein